MTTDRLYAWVLYGRDPVTGDGATVAGCVLAPDADAAAARAGAALRAGRAAEVGRALPGDVLGLSVAEVPADLMARALGVTPPPAR